MRFLLIIVAVVLAGLAGGAGGYRFGTGTWPMVATAGADGATRELTQRSVLYWRDPDGKPRYSAAPAAAADGRGFVPVYEDEEPDFLENAATPSPSKSGARRILYYRNPMGLPDVSAEPKKDWMGMDYIPVYADEAPAAPGVVAISLDRIQRSGVRTETVGRRSVDRPVRVPGVVRIDERRIQVVTVRADGFVEEVLVNTTGQPVRAGETLFRIYIPQVQQAQSDYLVAWRDARTRPDAERDRILQGPAVRLRNLGAPETRIRALRETGDNPRTLDWPAPMTGVVLEKLVVNGQMAKAGDALYRIADLATVWVIADVPEQDLSLVAVGATATMSFHAYPGETWRGRVTLVYPDLRPETRTARVRIELPNPERRLLADMYADVTIGALGDAASVLAVPESAVIDSGMRQVVLVAKGEGRFEPRAVKLGRRGDGYVEVTEGVGEGEEIVTTGTFLIDAESNLKAALKAFVAPEAAK